MESAPQCYYELLGVEAYSDDQSAIKKGYRKALLRWHPDKHGDKEGAQLAEVNRIFLTVQEAYDTLTDARLKKWYDEHREDILRGADAEQQQQSRSGVASPLFNLWPYFSSACYDTLDGSGGERDFFAVYKALFQRIWDIEPESRREEGSAPPSFGTIKMGYKKASKFYTWWKNFTSQLTFMWEDEYDPLNAPNRDVRRKMEQGNNKIRKAARKKYVEQVRNLVEVVKRRDPRISKGLREKREREERERQEKKERERIEKERLAVLKERAREERDRALEEDIPAEYWERIDERYADDEAGRGAESTVAEEALYCVVCSKSFKSAPQLKSHTNSKKHKAALKKLKKELLVQGEELPDTLDKALHPMRAVEEQQQEEGAAQRTRKKGSHQCADCKEYLAPSEFSKSQRKKRSGEARCLQCVQQNQKGGKKKKQQQQQQQQQQQASSNSDNGEQGTNKGSNNNDNNNNDNNDNDMGNGASDGDNRDAGDGDASVSEEENKEDEPSERTESHESRKKKKQQRKKAAKRKKKKQNMSDYRCAACNEQFLTRNKLFQHLNETGHAKPL